MTLVHSQQPEQAFAELLAENDKAQGRAQQAARDRQCPEAARTRGNLRPAAQGEPFFEGIEREIEALKRELRTALANENPRLTDAEKAARGL